MVGDKLLGGLPAIGIWSEQSRLKFHLQHTQKSTNAFALLYVRGLLTMPLRFQVLRRDVFDTRLIPHKILTNDQELLCFKCPQYFSVNVTGVSVRSEARLGRWHDTQAVYAGRGMVPPDSREANFTVIYPSMIVRAPDLTVATTTCLYWSNKLEPISSPGNGYQQNDGKIHLLTLPS